MSAYDAYDAEFNAHWAKFLADMRAATTATLRPVHLDFNGRLLPVPESTSTEEA